MSLWYLCCFLFLLPLLYVCSLTFFLICFCLLLSAIFALFLFLFVSIVLACFDYFSAYFVLLVCSLCLLVLPRFFLILFVIRFHCWSVDYLRAVASVGTIANIDKLSRRAPETSQAIPLYSSVCKSFQIVRCKSRKTRKRHRSLRPAFCNFGRPPRRLDFATSAGRRRPHAHPIAWKNICSRWPQASDLSSSFFKYEWIAYDDRLKFTYRFAYQSTPSSTKCLDESRWNSVQTPALSPLYCLKKSLFEKPEFRTENYFLYWSWFSIGKNGTVRSQFVVVLLADSSVAVGCCKTFFNRQSLFFVPRLVIEQHCSMTVGIAWNTHVGL